MINNQPVLDTSQVLGHRLFIRLVLLRLEVHPFFRDHADAASTNALDAYEPERDSKSGCTSRSKDGTKVFFFTAS